MPSGSALRAVAGLVSCVFVDRRFDVRGVFARMPDVHREPRFLAERARRVFFFVRVLADRLTGRVSFRGE